MQAAALQLYFALIHANTLSHLFDVLGDQNGVAFEHWANASKETHPVGESC